MVTSERVLQRLAALRCMAASTGGANRAARILSEFSRVVRENEGADVLTAQNMALNQY